MTANPFSFRCYETERAPNRGLFPRRVFSWEQPQLLIPNPEGLIGSVGFEVCHRHLDIIGAHARHGVGIGPVADKPDRALGQHRAQAAHVFDQG